MVSVSKWLRLSRTVDMREPLPEALPHFPTATQGLTHDARHVLLHIRPLFLELNHIP